MQHVYVHFKKGRLDEAERCLREGEKLDPKDRIVQLVKAAIALKRGEATLADAGKILDNLEKRLDDPMPKDVLFDTIDIPSFRDSYRYLRAIHTALSGKWEQGRDQLHELRDRDVMAESIGEAMAAFPRPVIILPVQGLGTPAIPPPKREK